MVIAPATANILAKFACGIADDLLSTTAMAVTAPMLAAPAMKVFVVMGAFFSGGCSHRTLFLLTAARPPQGRAAIPLNQRASF